MDRFGNVMQALPQRAALLYVLGMQLYGLRGIIGQMQNSTV